MDRLTFDGNFCDIAQCTELPCKEGMCSSRLVWERLKMYEDAEEFERMNRGNDETDLHLYE